MFSTPALICVMRLDTKNVWYGFKDGLIICDKDLANLSICVKSWVSEFVIWLCDGNILYSSKSCHVIWLCDGNINSS